MSDRAKHDKVMPANRLLAGADRMHPLCRCGQRCNSGTRRGDRGG